MIQMRSKRTIGAIAAVGVLAVAGIASAAGRGGGDDEGAPPSGASADAVAAALAATGGGKANAVELDNEKGAVWEVEVTRTDGSTVDVRLDGAYKVVAIDGDSEAGGDR